jgi:hypothetical protein
MTALRSSRLGLVFLAIAGVLTVTFLAGVQAGLLVILGIGFGLALQGYGFGFTGGWRRMIQGRDPSGMLAQMTLMVIASGLALPLLAAFPEELVGAVAPISWSLIIGAFVFGIAMQLADGCGSGSLNKAGAGNIYSWAVMPTFILGSFIGASHQPAWLALGGPLDGLAPDPSLGFSVSLVPALGSTGAILVNILLCILVGWGFLRMRARPTPASHDGKTASIPSDVLWNKSWLKAAVVIGVLYALHLAVAGQPWGIVYGLGLWGQRSPQGWESISPRMPSGALPLTPRALPSPFSGTLPRSQILAYSLALWPPHAGPNPDNAKNLLTARQWLIGWWQAWFWATAPAWPLAATSVVFSVAWPQRVYMAGSGSPWPFWAQFWE